ncbi:hypothetical protein CH063_05056 [Colletotrichum higginsianum]|uniref:Integral membrane protein n=2 Tax=Colletotrichum higginsianum TaxID=80884 RepID=H1UXM3_COLHI|nr:Integral membrane protein [Colletotrichum higginsianum IMI 349063]OBR12457.1 Integral membrane protein [Colletotrichum higginsianum IMI 349063]TIC98930.1 hypothetical protein CH35J_005432 [Colletotrichum higginsianum]CCF32724.1 hypothetical protein CH063_05056 [Colletotrichum higginsianum]
MNLYTEPPELRRFSQDKPSLLVCWWITSFCTVIILLRVAGRFIRTERLFQEDKVAALALIPLWLRMACVHFVLLYGTNNAQFDGITLSEEVETRKRIASGLVLASRIFYAATLWILKNTILEFFKRLTGVTWARSYEQTLVFIRCTLVATFIAIVISDLAECRPVHHYWQVTPDPGGQCRQGFAHLITMATCNILTDLLLVFFPIPIILRSQMNVKRKVQLTLLFSLSLSVIGVTIYRVPHVIRDHGKQQLRSVLASVELLFATTAANALVLGSFVRDRGIKKRKFKYGSVAADSMDRGSDSRRPTLHQHWGSDEDLVRDVGLGVDPDLRGRAGSQDELDTEQLRYTPAPVARPFGEELRQWQFPQRKGSNAERSDASLLPHDLSSSRSNSTTTPRRVSFFDVGGLLSEDQVGAGPTFRRDSIVSSVDPMSVVSGHGAPSPALPASSTGLRRGSTALLQDLGGFLGPLNTKHSRQTSRTGTELQPIPQSQHDDHPSYNPRPGEPTLSDPGGLLK